MGGTIDLEAIVAVRQYRIPVGVQPEDVGVDRYTGGIARNLNAVTEISREDIGLGRVVSSGGCDEKAIIAIGSGSLESQQPPESVEGDESAGRIAHFNAVLAIACCDVPQRNHTPDLSGRRTSVYQNSIVPIGNDCRIVRTYPKEVRLNRCVIRISDVEPVCTISAEHIIVHKGVVYKLAADQRVVVGAADRDSVQGIADCSIAVGGCANEIPVQDVPL